MLGVVKLSVSIMLSVLVLSVVMLGIFMLSVVVQIYGFKVPLV